MTQVIVNVNNVFLEREGFIMEKKVIDTGLQTNWVPYIKNRRGCNFPSPF